MKMITCIDILALSYSDDWCARIQGRAYSDTHLILISILFHLFLLSWGIIIILQYKNNSMQHRFHLSLSHFLSLPHTVHYLPSFIIHTHTLVLLPSLTSLPPLSPPLFTPLSFTLFVRKIKNYYINHATLWKSQLQLADQQQIESCLVILIALLQY